MNPYPVRCECGRHFPECPDLTNALPPLDLTQIQPHAEHVSRLVAQHYALTVPSTHGFTQVSSHVS